MQKFPHHRLSAALYAALLLTPIEAFAQEDTNPQSARPEKRAHQKKAQDDIIVEGYRDTRKLPTQVEAPPVVSGVKSRQRYEVSERVAECAARGKVAPLKRLRAVVDGEFNTPTHALAQDRLRRSYISCGEGGAILNFTRPDPLSPAISASMHGPGNGVYDFEGTPMNNDPAPLGHSIYDRGAFQIEAIRRFAPDLLLTRENISDPKVRERFLWREQPRNRFRGELDQYYFGVANCMVQREPELSVRLVMNEGPVERSGLQAAIINRGRSCVNNAKMVKADPTQFRIYIADAVYRWAVAVRNVDSLVPREEHN